MTKFFDSLDLGVDWKSVCERAYAEYYGKLGEVSVEPSLEETASLYESSVKRWCVRIAYSCKFANGAVVTPYVASEDFLPYCYRDAVRMLAVKIFGTIFDSDEEMMLNLSAGGYA